MGCFVVVINDQFEPCIRVHILESKLCPLTACSIGFFAFFGGGEGQDGVEFFVDGIVGMEGLFLFSHRAEFEAAFALDRDQAAIGIEGAEFDVVGL